MARPTLDRNVKFKTLSRLLGSRATARGHLELMWDVANECGEPEFRSALEVEAAAEWGGEPGVLFDALLGTGFIDETEDGYEIHDYWDHAPDYVRKRRARELQRKDRSADLRAKEAEKRRTTADTDQSLTGQRRTTADTDRETAPNGRTPAPAPAPAHNREKTSSSCSEPQATPEPIALDGFPCSKSGVTWSLTESKLAEYRESFPHLDVLAEAKKARQWLRDTPARRKTEKGMPRFLTGWLTRAQDSGRGARQPQRAAVNNSIGATPDPTENPWHPDDVLRFGQTGDPHHLWGHYWTAMEREHGTHAGATRWPRFEAWVDERAEWLSRVDGKRAAS